MLEDFADPVWRVVMEDAAEEVNPGIWGKTTMC